MFKKQRAIDSKLVIEYQSGNKSVLPVLVKTWHKSFCEKAFWLVKDADVAKDIAQESWTVIIKNLPNLKKPQSFGGWASRIVYSKSLDWLKANNRRKKVIQDYKIEQDTLEYEEDDNEQVKLELLKTIKTLPENQQVVIRLFYKEDYSLKEIGAILNISPGTVKSRLFHARETLKKKLKK